MDVLIENIMLIVDRADIPVSIDIWRVE